MRTLYSALAVAVLLIGPGYGQPAETKVEKMFHFANTETPAGFQEISYAIRGVGEIQQVSVVATSKALAVRGPAGSVALAEWLFGALDQPDGASRPAKLEFAVPGASNDFARVFYLTNASTPQATQEIINSVRSLSEIQRVVFCSQPRAVALRGTGPQIALAEWIIRALDIPSGGGPLTTQSMTLNTPEFRTKEGNPTTARVFYPAHIVTAQHFQESVNMIRAIAEVQRIMFYQGAGAIVMRGSAEQAALAEWVLKSLDPRSKAEALPVQKADLR